jgi:hypothetical protein
MNQLTAPTKTVKITTVRMIPQLLGASDVVQYITHGIACYSFDGGSQQYCDVGLPPSKEQRILVQIIGCHSYYHMYDVSPMSMNMKLLHLIKPPSMSHR